MYNSELITYLSSSVEDNMEFTIDRTYSEVSFDSFLCGFYVQKDIWTPFIGEELNCKREDQNKHNKFAVTIYQNTLVDEFVVGNVRICESFFLKFLQLPRSSEQSMDWKYL